MLYSCSASKNIASKTIWSERSVCDKRSNLGRPLLLVLVFLLFFSLANVTQCVAVVVNLAKYWVIKSKCLPYPIIILHFSICYSVTSIFIYSLNILFCYILCFLYFILLYRGVIFSFEQTTKIVIYYVTSITSSLFNLKLQTNNFIFYRSPMCANFFFTGVSVCASTSMHLVLCI